MHDLSTSAPAARIVQASFGNLLFSAGFFAIALTLLVRAAKGRAQRTDGPLKVLWYAVLFPLAFVIARIAIDTARDPTSHNLWPFELVIWGVPTLVAWWVLRRVLRSVTISDPSGSMR